MRPNYTEKQVQKPNSKEFFYFSGITFSSPEVLMMNLNRDSFWFLFVFSARTWITAITVGNQERKSEARKERARHGHLPIENCFMADGLRKGKRRRRSWFSQKSKNRVKQEEHVYI